MFDERKKTEMEKLPDKIINRIFSRLPSFQKISVGRLANDFWIVKFAQNIPKELLLDTKGHSFTSEAIWRLVNVINRDGQVPFSTK